MTECYNSQVGFDSKRRFLNAGYLVGEWLSLVEHLVRDQGVGGSNPLSPTILSILFSSISQLFTPPLLR